MNSWRQLQNVNGQKVEPWLQVVGVGEAVHRRLDVGKAVHRQQGVEEVVVVVVEEERQRVATKPRRRHLENEAYTQDLT